jgi:hypothetical protein
MSNHSNRTPKRDERFLRALTEGQTVSVAAKLAGYVRRTVYDWKRDDPEFTSRWQDAVDEAVDRLEAEADRRGVEGTLRPVFWKGVEVGHVREFSDTLLIFRLKALRPDKYRERVVEPVARPQEPSQLSELELARRVAFLLQRPLQDRQRHG